MDADEGEKSPSPLRPTDIMTQTHLNRTQGFSLRLALQVAALSTAAIHSSAIAADISMLAADAVGASSFTGAGQWSNAAPPSTGNNYFTAGFQVRTPTTAGSFTFGGDSLTIDAGANSRLLGKGAGTGTTQTITVPNLILNGGRLEQAGGESTNNIVFAVNGSINVVAPSFMGAIGANANGSANFEVMDIGAMISGSAGLSVAGTGNGGVNRGVVRLSAANTYTGQIDVLQPTNGNTISSTTHRLLQLNHPDALRFATLGLLTTAENPVSFASAANTGVFRVGALAGTASQTLADTAGVPVTLEVGGSGQDSFYAGTLKGAGSLVKAGTGTVILQGLNHTYSGGTTIHAGVLSLGPGSSMNNGSAVTIDSGASLELFHEETDVVNSLVLNGVPQADGIYDASTPGGYISGNGKLRVVAGNVSLTANDAAGGSSLNNAGNWSDLLAPSSAHPYFTQAFTLRTPASAGDFTFEGASLSLDTGGRLLGKGAGTAGAQQSVTFTNLVLNGGRLEQASGDVPGAVLSVKGSVTAAAESYLGALAATTAGSPNFETLEIAANISGSAPLHVAGTANGSANRGVVKLSAANSYTGTISVEQPTLITSTTNRLLQLNHLDALQHATLSLLTTTENGVSFASGANTGSFKIGALTGTASQVLADTDSAPVAVNVGSNNASTSFDGVLSGPGSVVKSGTGTLTFTGTNAYTGDTTVSAGTLSLSQATLADTSTITIEAGAVLNLTHEGIDDVASLVLGGVEQEEGTYTAANSGGRITGSGSIRVSGIVPVTGFAGFMDQFPGLSAEDKAADADPDGDGIINLLEYALDGLNPTAPSTLPALASGGISFTKRALAVSNGDVIYEIQSSPTLGADPSPWTTVTPDVDSETTISYTLPTGPLKNFVRLRVLAVSAE